MRRDRHHSIIVAALAGCSGILCCAALGSGAATGVAPSLAVAATGGTGRLTLAQIGAVAEQAGFRADELAMAIAVAVAESGGDPGATDHDANGTVDRGLWQINSVHRAFDAACDYDPSCAASAAYAISDGGRDWSPWVTYQRGEEIAYLPAALSWVESRPT